MSFSQKLIEGLRHIVEVVIKRKLEFIILRISDVLACGVLTRVVVTRVKSVNRMKMVRQSSKIAEYCVIYSVV